jgi:hypothetical protein
MHGQTRRTTRADAEAGDFCGDRRCHDAEHPRRGSGGITTNRARLWPRLMIKEEILTWEMVWLDIEVAHNPWKCLTSCSGFLKSFWPPWPRRERLWFRKKWTTTLKYRDVLIDSTMLKDRTQYCALQSLTFFGRLKKMRQQSKSKSVFDCFFNLLQDSKDCSISTEVAGIWATAFKGKERVMFIRKDLGM